MVNCEEIDESAKKNLHNNQKMKIFPRAVVQSSCRDRWCVKSEQKELQMIINFIKLNNQAIELNF